jgi:hypothetical protein
LPSAPRWFDRFTRHVGRRGASLLVFAFVDLAIGYSLLDPGQRPGPAAAMNYAVIRAVLPFAAWGGIWFAAGAACLLGAFWTSARSSGFSVTAGVMILWAAGFAVAAISYDAPRAWVAAAIWAVIAAFVFLIGGWPEPNEPYRRPPYWPQDRQ